MKEWDEDKREALRKALPVLKKIRKLSGDFEWGYPMRNIYDEAKRQIEIIERCIKFDIWTDNNWFEYGSGIYIMHNVNDDRYDNDNPEELLQISFPTGAYFFGERYDTEYFKQYYNELRSAVEPDYEVIENHELLYKPEHARAAWDSYKAITKKYADNNRERARQWKIEQTKKELDRLMSEGESK